MNEIEMTLAGHVAAVPTVRQTQGGHTMATFRVASTVRRPNRETGGWEDGATTFFQVTCWRATAENVAASLRLGDAVMVHGRFTARPYTDRDGRDRMSLDVDATSVGLNLRGGTARLDRGPRAAVSSDPFAGETATEAGVGSEAAPEPGTEPEAAASAAVPGAFDAGRDSELAGVG